VRASDPSGLMPNGVGGGGCSTKECTADHWLFHVTLPRFQAQRDKVCGSAVNEPFKGKNGKQNCWQHGNSHGKFFDWSSDGCSPFPNFENDPVFEGWTVFNWKTGHFWKACERHDFGYRNYKEEGRFSRSTKHHIDENFRHDLNAFICDPMGSPYANECHGLSAAYFEVVEKTPPFSQ